MWMCVGVGGHSWGGYLTLMSMCDPLAAGVFSCGMSGAGISDLAIQLRETELRPYDRQILGGWPYEKEKEWRERSAVTNADKLAAPFLIQHGADDLNVPYSQIVEFVAAAEKATAPNAKVTFISYEGEKHGNQKPPNQENCESSSAATVNLNVLLTALSHGPFSEALLRSQTCGKRLSSFAST